MSCDYVSIISTAVADDAFYKSRRKLKLEILMLLPPLMTKLMGTERLA